MAAVEKRPEYQGIAVGKSKSLCAAYLFVLLPFSTNSRE